MSPLLLILAGFAVLFILGAGVAFIAGNRQTVVGERLEEFVSSAGVVELPEDDVVSSSLKKPDYADKLDNLLSGRTFFGSIQDRVRRFDIKLRVSEYIILMVVCGVLAAAAAYFFFG